MNRTEKEIFDELSTLCISPGYVHAIAYFCFRDNSIGFKDELTTKDLLKGYAPSRLIKTEISILIGLVVRKPIDLTIPTPEIINEYIKRTEMLLKEMHHAISRTWSENLDTKKASFKDFNPFCQGEFLREPILYGGESAYSFQYRDMAPQKYSNDDVWLQKNKGFSIAVASSTINAIAKIHEKKIAICLSELAIKLPNEWTLLPGYIFHISEISEQSGFAAEEIEPVLSAFTLDLHDRNIMFDAPDSINSTNIRPIIKIKDDTYLLFQHFSLLETFYESPFYWMMDDPKYAQIAMKNRGKFTENFIRERLETVFLENRVFGNVDIFRKESNKIGEIDVLVLFGDRAIIIQAKSKRLTIKSRKGDDNILRDDFKKAIQNSYDQAHKCATELLSGSAKFTTSDRIIPIEKPTTIYIICLVSDHYPALNFQVQQFLEQKKSDKICPPIITDIFALDAIAEMLNTPLQFVNYIDLRARFSHRIYTMYELTLLSEHLKRNLWIGNEHKIIHFSDDIGVDLDVAMTVRRGNLPGKCTPDGILTRYKNTPLGQIIDYIERHDDPAMTDLGLMLLQIDEDTGIALNRNIRAAIRKVRNDGTIHDLTVPIPYASSGLTIHCMNESPIPDTITRLLCHCEIRKYSWKANSWFGLFLDPKDGAIRLGFRLDCPWESDRYLDFIVSKMPTYQPISAFSRRKKTGRNDPCPCGSGKKFKKCCEL